MPICCWTQQRVIGDFIDSWSMVFSKYLVPQKCVPSGKWAFFSDLWFSQISSVNSSFATSGNTSSEHQLLGTLGGDSFLQSFACFLRDVPLGLYTKTNITILVFLRLRPTSVNTENERLSQSHTTLPCLPCEQDVCIASDILTVFQWLQRPQFRKSL